jgi:hypothetical protein
MVGRGIHVQVRQAYQRALEREKAQRERLPPVGERRCAACGLTKAQSVFDGNSEICRDCS